MGAGVAALAINTSTNAEAIEPTNLPAWT